MILVRLPQAVPVCHSWAALAAKRTLDIDRFVVRAMSDSETDPPVYYPPESVRELQQLARDLETTDVVRSLSISSRALDQVPLSMHRPALRTAQSIDHPDPGVGANHCGLCGARVHRDRGRRGPLFCRAHCSGCWHVSHVFRSTL